MAYAPRRIRPQGLLLVEVADSRAAAAAELASNNPMLADVRILKDIEGLPRVIAARRV
jgi:methylase of polypeptide subunit release factors